MLTKHELDEIMSKWGISIKGYTVVTKGIVNTNWIIISSEGKFVLRRLSHFKNLKSLGLEISYLHDLKNHNFPYQIPIPIKNRNERFFLTYKRQYFWLYKYIPGSFKNQLNKLELNELAIMMKKYHNIVKISRFNKIKKPEVDPFFRNAILRESLRLKKLIFKGKFTLPQDKIFLNWLSLIIPILKEMKLTPYSKLRTYPLHGDIKQDNLLWKESKLIGILDFDNIGRSNFTIIKDLSVVLQYCCVKKKDRTRLNFKLARFFLNAYADDMKLSTNEMKAIPLLITLQYIDLFNYTYWLLKNNPNRAKLSDLVIRAKAAKWYYQNKEKIFTNLKF
ncbi:MAG: phosphotransferase [Candidatus Micrarchaeota archaeon]|nr:phosphotransferase [Candidatus Micrarchaeota archaeon]